MQTKCDAMPRPSMGSEDFADYLEHVPGTMFRLGAAATARLAGPAHADVRRG